MKKFAYSALVLTLALIALPNGAMAATKTLDNLQAGFNGESNAHARYLASQKKPTRKGTAKLQVCSAPQPRLRKFTPPTMPL